MSWTLKDLSHQHAPITSSTVPATLPMLALSLTRKIFLVTYPSTWTRVFILEARLRSFFASFLYKNYSPITPLLRLENFIKFLVVSSPFSLHHPIMSPHWVTAPPHHHPTPNPDPAPAYPPAAEESVPPAAQAQAGEAANVMPGSTYMTTPRVFPELLPRPLPFYLRPA